MPKERKTEVAILRLVIPRSRHANGVPDTLLRDVRFTDDHFKKSVAYYEDMLYTCQQRYSA